MLRQCRNNEGYLEMCASATRELARSAQACRTSSGLPKARLLTLAAVKLVGLPLGPLIGGPSRPHAVPAATAGGVAPMQAFSQSLQSELMKSEVKTCYRDQ